MSTGVKHDSGKPAMELIDADAMEDLARVLEFGRRKYGAHNWRGGIGIGRLIGAALRHTFAFMRGEDTDPESGPESTGTMTGGWNVRVFMSGFIWSWWFIRLLLAQLASTRSVL